MDESSGFGRRLLSTAFGLAVCAGSAAVAAKLFVHTSFARLEPILFLGVLVVLAGFYGTAVGVLGSLLSAVIFAYLLYAPLHSTQVSDAGARSSLAWLVVGGIALSYLLAPGFHNPPRE